MGHRLDVSRVHASMDKAQMVGFCAFGEWADEMLVCPSMRRPSPSTDVDSTVPATVAFALPDPTRAKPWGTFMGLPHDQRLKPLRRVVALRRVKRISVLTPPLVVHRAPAPIGSGFVAPFD